MYLSILVQPLLASVIATNRYCGIKGGPIQSVLCQKKAAKSSIIIFYEVGISGSPVSIELGNWIDQGILGIEWNLYYDTLTASKYLPIVIISFIIQIYSQEYKGHDAHKSRFFSLLSLFAVTMLILVTGENLLIILLGWEGVGIVSYQLVNFWYTRKAANKASKSAQFLNKIGDMFLIIALILGIAVFSDLSLSTIFSLSGYINGDILFILIICLILAASAKSALIGFTPWLAYAKEGPTSVSALLHSSTKVTAGVYLLKRISPLLELSSTSLKIVVWLGSLGALFGAKCGLVDNDIKRIVAFSTISQLGYKIVAVGISQYNQALFHLIQHAGFKSLLFQSSGAILHAVKDNQNQTRKGSLNIMLPFTYLVFLFASLSLKAFPFTSGFYSKDLLLELLCVPHNFTNTIAYIFTLLAALQTSTYSIRVMMKAMLSRPLFPKAKQPFVTDSPLLKTIPLIILSVAAVMFGYLTHELFLSFGSTFYLNSIYTHPNTTSFLFDASFGGSLVSLIPVTFQLLILLILVIKNPFISHKDTRTIKGILIGNDLQDKNQLQYSGKANLNFNQTTHFTLLNHFNVFYHWIKYIALVWSNHIYRYLDKGVLEFFGPLGFLKLLHYWGFLIELISTGFIPHYAYILVLSLILFQAIPFKIL